mmetsp:Transcript_90318/g.258437  ORF Transcript_90318/g.258437 Transcript_90318/m.258437 type:complete len:219 (-) Transcript_90318:101-757(-)
MPVVWTLTVHVGLISVARQVADHLRCLQVIQRHVAQRRDAGQQRPQLVVLTGQEGGRGAAPVLALLMVRGRDHELQAFDLAEQHGELGLGDQILDQRQPHVLPGRQIQQRHIGARVRQLPKRRGALGGPTATSQPQARAVRRPLPRVHGADARIRLGVGRRPQRCPHELERGADVRLVGCVQAVVAEHPERLLVVVVALERRLAGPGPEREQRGEGEG